MARTDTFITTNHAPRRPQGAGKQRPYYGRKGDLTPGIFALNERLLSSTYSISRNYFA